MNASPPPGERGKRRRLDRRSDLAGLAALLLWSAQVVDVG
jgi:hypothetical protein